MDSVEVGLEVHAHIPEWAKHALANGKLSHPRYRLYLNNELITERTWTWNSNVFIDERVIAYLEKETIHTLKIETIAKDPVQIKFKGRLKSMGQIKEINYITESNISFKL